MTLWKDMGENWRNILTERIRSSELGPLQKVGQAMKSTDVKHSIAGFYFQLLIACYELVNVYEYADAYVGVECDADIRVNYGDDKFIEAKFYSNDTFTRNQEAIRHTIYNFYHTYKKTRTTGVFQIKTNVPIADEDCDFFNFWNKKSFSDPMEYINYVKDCLVYEYIEKEEAKSTFDEFKLSYKNLNPHLKRPQYKRALIDNLHQNPDEYRKYLSEDVLIDDHEIFDFIKLVSFDCPKKKIDKYDSIVELKEKTELRLSQYFPGFTNVEYENIRYLIMNAFLDTTVDKTLFVVKTTSLNQILENHAKAVLELFNNDMLARSIKDIETELIKYELLLKRKGHSDKMESILKIVGSCTEQWINDMKQFGIEKVNSRYLMGNSQHYTLSILELFKAMGEIYSLASKELGKVYLSDLEGINNILFTAYKGFSLRTTPHPSDKQDNELLITAFIEHTLKEQELLRAVGDETIIFDAECRICDYDKTNIQDIIMDVSKPYGTILQQEFYQSFEYRCTKCLRLLTHNDTCPFSKNFKEGLV